jgi:ABC-2 type transport system ATP-binding protein
MLTASHLSRRFGERLAVSDVSFDLAPGEVFALLGPNGAGKTTTLRMIAGLIAPTSGAVRVDGEQMTPANAPRLRGRIGFLTETPGLWERLTVRRNLITYAHLHGLPEAAATVDAALETFGIRDRANEAAARLSKGLKQRVALARTLLHSPNIILLDEPTSGLDPQSAREMRELILRLRKEGRAVILSTHNLDEVERVADRVAVLRTGLVAVDTPDALRTRLFGSRVNIGVSGRAEAYVSAIQAAGARDIRVERDSLSIGLANGVSVPRLVRELVQAGAEITSVTPEERPLEDVYLHLLRDQPQ